MIRKILSLLIVLALLIPSGCARSSSSDSKDNFTIVTSFYPIYITTINLTKGIPGVEVVNLTQPQTGCLHDYQLKPEDLITLESADAFVINGAGMESFLQQVLDQQANLPVIESSAGISLLKDVNGAENPHVWVSIRNSMIQTQTIADQLATLDSPHAEAYQANAKAYIDKLETLRTAMHAAIDPLPNKKIITFHEAFPYFAQEFGLTIAAVIEREPGTSPTAKELTETIDIVKSSGIKALFAEPQYLAEAADTIASETGARVYRLDPGVTGEADLNYDAYLEIMEQNMLVLKEALQPAE